MTFVRRLRRKAQTCDGHHSLAADQNGTNPSSASMARNARPREIVMIKTRTGMLGAVSLLLSVLLKPVLSKLHLIDLALTITVELRL